jgi:hypothetical protein
MNARTKTLFHFTKSLDVLLRILEEGFWPRYWLEDITWLDGGVPRLAWPMVSFCDIPISRLREHTEFYGNYGIGLVREQWQATGLNPVLYVTPDSMLKDLLRELLLAVRKNPDPRVKTAAMVVLRARELNFRVLCCQSVAERVEIPALESPFLPLLLSGPHKMFQTA